MLNKCPRCGSEGRIMGQVCVSAPSKNMYHLPKTVFRSKDIEIWGVLWETFEFICNKCHYIEQAYGNYVTNLKKENEELKKEIEKIKNEN